VNIREFAQHTGLSAHTLRYYERAGLMGDVARDEHGHRVYGQQDSQWVNFLNHLRETGMSIREMERYCSLRSQGDASLAGRLALLTRHTDQLAQHLREQHEHLAKLRETVALYQARVNGRGGRGTDGRDITAAPPREVDPAHRR
jgi:DNA-binding transcriptional MerR regulator